MLSFMGCAFGEERVRVRVCACGSLAASQARQLAAAYEKLAADSERHIKALQRSLAASVEERNGVQAQVDEGRIQIDLLSRDVAALQIEQDILQGKVRDFLHAVMLP